MSEERDLAVALSGGGHRATVFGLGALLAIVDSGLNRSVRSISSVSGGSIANGVVMTGPDFTTVDTPGFEQHIAPALRAIADRGVLLGGAPAGTKPLRKLVAWCTRSAPATRGYLRNLLVSGILAIVALLVASVALVLHAWIVTAVAAAVFVVAGWLFLRWLRCRSVRTEQAIDTELLGGAGITLAQVAERRSSVHHVICTTELQTGVSFYFTNRCVYGWGFGGAAATTDLPLATAVQASACVPGAFAPRRIALRQLGIEGAGDIVVDDGGVYDNMADEWEYGFPGRAKSWKALTTFQPERAGRLLAVNASGGWNSKKPIGTGGLAEELAGLLRAKDVQYDVSTAHRRRALHSMFVAAERDRRQLDGLFAQITASPFDAPTSFAQRPGWEPDDLSRRAGEARAFLEAQGYTEAWWEEQATRTSGVATTLEALGTQCCADLLEHGYVLTMINLYVFDGLGALRPVDRDRFRRLCSGASSVEAGR